MKYTLPILSAVLVAAFIAAAALRGETPSSDALHSAGQLLVGDAAERISRYESLHARIRQRVNMFERKLAGTGSYSQARRDGQVLLRLELKLPVGNGVTTLQQVNDGDRLWTRKDTPLEKRLTSVELRRVRTAVARREIPASRLLALGGLGQLLAGIHEQFEFGEPREGTLGDAPVWIIEGRWKQSVGPDGKPQPLANHLPDAVRLVLSRSDALPLFPFQIDFSREREDEKGAKQRVSLLAVDFYEVTVGGPVDHRLYAYNAGDQQVIDETDRYLKR